MQPETGDNPEAQHRSCRVLTAAMLPGSTNYLFYRLEAFGGLETPIAQRRAADGYVVRNALRQLRAVSGTFSPNV